MGTKKEYRSSLRSKRLIREAFLELLEENQFKKITITDIVNRADINRATFYAHYPDIRGLMEEIEEELSSKVYKIIRMHKEEDVSAAPRAFISDITDFVVENKNMFKILLLSPERAHFSEGVFEVAHNAAVSRNDITKEKKDSLFYKVNVQYYVGGFIGVYHDWILGKIICSKEDLVNELTNIITRTSSHGKDNSIDTVEYIYL